MSFILDALKKSEAERQRQNSPGIASIPHTERRRSGPKWIWIISALLVVNLAALVGIMLRSGTNSESIAVNEIATENPAPRAAPARQAPAPAAAIPATQAEAAPRREPVTTAPAQQPPAEPAAEPVNRPVQRMTEGLPSLNELRAQGVLQLPEMHLDIHVYSGQPADRFVFVNMKKYTEGATLSEGPAIREITKDGVVLDYLGTRFLLPRE